jgi:hypothetical protein
MLHRFLPVFALLLGLGACSQGGTYDFSAVNPVLTISSGRTVSASVIDQRPYVVNGEESPRFVGSERGQHSNTIEIRTASGRPLAEELTDAVVRALDRRGVAASALPLPKGTPEEALLTAFQAQGTERLLAVQMYEWRTKAHTRVTSRWHMEAIVYDRSGHILARGETQGYQPVGRTGLSGGSGGIASREVTRKLSELLNEPAITAALK